LFRPRPGHRAANRSSPAPSRGPELTLEQVVRLAVAVALLLSVAIGVAVRWRLGQARDLLVVTGRAVVQLVLVGLVLRLIFATPGLAPLYLGLMVVVAAFTSSRRFSPESRRSPDPAWTFGMALTSIGLAAGVTAGIVVASGAISAHARDIVPFTAQVIGGSMTATTLAGSRLRDDVLAHWPEVEGWLALGARPRQAVRDLAIRAASRAIVPALDQTRNVGLVVLPGAFVGLLLAGASPLEAGRIQLLVLIALLTAETIAAVVVTQLLGPSLAAPGSRRRP
jgi:putative ABC transport system permease protein